MAYNPGFCGQARRGGAAEKGGDFILCEVVFLPFRRKLGDYLAHIGPGSGSGG